MASSDLGPTPIILGVVLLAVAAGAAAYFLLGPAPVDCSTVGFEECKDTPGCERLYIDGETGPSGKCVPSD